MANKCPFEIILSRKTGMVAEIYKPKFVLNIGQMGEEDPLWSNVLCCFLIILLFDLFYDS
jgi:hypothetical protein